MYACSTMYGNVIGPFAPGSSIYNRFAENKETITPRSGTKRVSYDKIKPYRPVVENRGVAKRAHVPAPEKPLAYNLFGQPKSPQNPAEGQQFTPVPETSEGVLPPTEASTEELIVKKEYAQQKTQTSPLESIFRKARDLGLSGMEAISLPGKSTKTRNTGTNPVVSYGVETKEQATSPLNVGLNTLDNIIGDRPTMTSIATSTAEILGPTMFDMATNTEYGETLNKIVQTIKFKGKNQKIQTDYLGFDRGTQTSPLVNSIVSTPIEDTGVMEIDEREFDSTRPIIDVVMDEQSTRPLVDVVMDEQSRRPLRDVVMDEQSRRPLRDVVMDDFIDSQGNFQSPKVDTEVVKVIRANGKSQRMSPTFKAVSPTESSGSSKSRTRKKPAPITTNLSPSSGSGSSGKPLIQTVGPRSASSSGSSGKPLMQTVGPRSASSSGSSGKPLMRTVGPPSAGSSSSSGKPLMQTVKTPKKRGRPKKKK